MRGLRFNSFLTAASFSPDSLAEDEGVVSAAGGGVVSAEDEGIGIGDDEGKGEEDASRDDGGGRAEGPVCSADLSSVSIS